MRELTLGSLFDGLGGWLLAAKENGMAHPCASFVLAQIVKAERG